MTGLSAGGHLAALLATSGGVAQLEGNGGNASESSGVQAGVEMAAQSDLETERIRTLSIAPENPHYRPFLGGSLDTIPQIYALASPRHHLDKSDPPLLFMTNELDDPSTHADEAREDLKRLGIETGLISQAGCPWRSTCRATARKSRPPWQSAGSSQTCRRLSATVMISRS